jgi:flagellar protein FliS
MARNPYERHREEQVAAASPVELVVMLYEELKGRVTRARQSLQRGEIAPRSAHITRSIEILVELSSTLDRSRGGEVAASLARLYDYLTLRLQEANLSQTESPLIEVEALVGPLLEAWREVCGAGEPAGPPLDAVEARPVYASYSW